MEREEIKELVTEAVRAVLAEQEQKKQQQERQQVLRNTRMLMEGYRAMKKHLESAISEIRELEKEEYSVFGEENRHLESIRQSKVRTALMIAHIDKAMEELKAEMELAGTSYKYEAFRMHYIEGLPFEDISERLNCGKNTPSRWIKDLIKRLSVKLFGIDGIEKW